MRICAGGLLVRQGRILLARRSADRSFYPGVRDVIGGHCERDEAPADALGIDVQSGNRVRVLVNGVRLDP